MLSELTGADLFASVMMMRQGDRRLVLILEGSDDCSLLDPHINDSDISTVPGFGKASVIEALALVQSAGFPGILGVVDSDFDFQTGRCWSYPSGVVPTEFYDLDSDMIFGEPRKIRKVCANFGDRKERVGFLERVGSTELDLIVRAASILGALRFESVTRGLALDLRSFPMKIVMKNLESQEVYDQVLDIALKRTTKQPPAGFDSVELAAAHRRWEDPRTICNGHDLAAALSVLCRLWSGGAGASPKVLASVLRSSTSCRAITGSVIGGEVETWASSMGKRAWNCDDDASA